MQAPLVFASVVSVLLWCAVQGRPEDIEYTLGKHGDVRNGTRGAYKFHYEVPGHSSRVEEYAKSSEEDDMEIKGNYTFVSPEGIKFEFKYEADYEDGFTVESDALPVAPENTEEVQQARAAFNRAYCTALGKEPDCDLVEYFHKFRIDAEEGEHFGGEEE
ncbi:unnamed protein product [Meganyctiphanes norvegica]|uniref:Uncharacterized protein n=1 Tax=Meganyctiphanes norvegica TaxID=48144 RepID=A0AAV2QSH3_MEGNR